MQLIQHYPKLFAPTTSPHTQPKPLVRVLLFDPQICSCLFSFNFSLSKSQYPVKFFLKSR